MTTRSDLANEYQAIAEGATTFRLLILMSTVNSGMFCALWEAEPLTRVDGVKPLDVAIDVLTIICYFELTGSTLRACETNSPIRDDLCLGKSMLQNEFKVVMMFRSVV